MKSINTISLIKLFLFFALALPIYKCKVYSYSDNRFYYQGRSYVDSSGLRYDWPCTTINFCFVNATKVWWLGVDEFSHYKVIINQNHTQSLIPRKNNKVLMYQGKQTPIQNCIKIVKITEDHFGPLGTRKDAVFKGVELEGNYSDLVFVEHNYKYRFQFVGDSLTVGYGDMSGTNIKCFFRMRHNEDCLQSWATHLSKKLNAQYRITAESGKGVVKNAPFIFGQVMPVLFSKITSNSKPNTYHYQDKYKPDAVFVFLGVNDYNNLIKPGQHNFIFGYEKMLTQIVKSQIDSTGNMPKIIGLCTADFPDYICNYVEQAIKSFRYAYQKAYFVEVPKGIFVKGNMGCINHPNAKGQAKVAESIYEKVKKILES